MTGRAAEQPPSALRTSGMCPAPRMRCGDDALTACREARVPGVRAGGLRDDGPGAFAY